MKVLAYHSIGDSVAEVGAKLYCVPEEVFRRQMEYLCKTQVTRAQERKAQETWVELTFDDGDITNYTKALPILREFGVKASFFIIGEWVGASGYMNWREIKELKDHGMTIGSHGMTHRILTGLNDKDLDYELRESKRLLEKNLGCGIDKLSIPRGFCSAKIIEKAKEIGYKTIFTSDNRIVVRSDWDMERFIRAVNGRHTVSEKVGGLIKRLSKRLLGARSYDIMRTKILNLRPMS
jgi:peptidoglycan/xylan/chitin deacetylase (PgdA/CDA1 family)